MSAVAVSVFDLDETLLRGQSGALWISYLVARKLAPPALLGRLALVEVMRKKGVDVDLDGAAREIAARFRGLPVSGMETAIEAFVENRLLPAIRPEATRALEELRALGHRVVVASTSIAPIVERVANRLGVDAWLATGLVPSTDGSFSGQLNGPLLIGQAKLAALLRLASFRWRDWRLARVYSHFETDVGLFQQAAEPVAVNPPDRLRAVAHARGWRVVHWD